MIERILQNETRERREYEKARTALASVLLLSSFLFGVSAPFISASAATVAASKKATTTKPVKPVSTTPQIIYVRPAGTSGGTSGGSSGSNSGQDVLGQLGQGLAPIAQLAQGIAPLLNAFSQMGGLSGLMSLLGGGTGGGGTQATPGGPQNAQTFLGSFYSLASGYMSQEQLAHINQTLGALTPEQFAAAQKDFQNGSTADKMAWKDFDGMIAKYQTGTPASQTPTPQTPTATPDVPTATPAVSSPVDTATPATGSGAGTGDAVTGYNTPSQNIQALVGKGMYPTVQGLLNKTPGGEQELNAKLAALSPEEFKKIQTEDIPALTASASDPATRGQLIALMSDPAKMTEKLNSIIDPHTQATQDALAAKKEASAANSPTESPDIPAVKIEQAGTVQDTGTQPSPTAPDPGAAKTDASAPTDKPYSDTISKTLGSGYETIGTTLDGATKTVTNLFDSLFGGSATPTQTAPELTPGASAAGLTIGADGKYYENGNLVSPNGDGTIPTKNGVYDPKTDTFTNESDGGSGTSGDAGATVQNDLTANPEIHASFQDPSGSASEPVTFTTDFTVTQNTAPAVSVPDIVLPVNDAIPPSGNSADAYNLGNQITYSTAASPGMPNGDLAAPSIPTGLPLEIAGTTPSVSGNLQTQNPEIIPLFDASQPGWMGWVSNTPSDGQLTDPNAPQYSFEQNSPWAGNSTDSFSGYSLAAPAGDTALPSVPDYSLSPADTFPYSNALSIQGTTGTASNIFTNFGSDYLPQDITNPFDLSNLYPADTANLPADTSSLTLSDYPSTDATGNPIDYTDYWNTQASLPTYDTSSQDAPVIDTTPVCTEYDEYGDCISWSS